MNNFKSQYLKFPVKFPFITIIVSLIATIALTTGIFYVKIDDDFVKMFPENIPSKMLWDEIQNEFGSTEHLVIAFGKKGQSILDDDIAYSNLIDLVRILQNL